MTLRTIMTLTFVSLAAWPVSAQVFTDEGTFNAAAGATLMESFEGLTANNPLVPGDLETVVVADFELMNNNGSPNLGVTDAGFAFPPTDGNNSITWYASGPATQVTFTFNAPVDAFAVDVIGYGNVDPQDLLFTTDTGLNGTAAVSGGGSTNVQFFGVVEPGMTSITIDRSGTTDAMAFDSVHYAFVPEPGGWTMMLMAVGLVIGRLRR